MSLPPILYHYFRVPLPYAQTLALQERIHQIQLAARRTASHKDVLLLLQHRPVYTAGRRQTEDDVADERRRLTNMGADFVPTQRGGQLTYHGPGQIIGYPLVDTARWSPSMGVRDYVCRMQKFLNLHLREAHGLEPSPSDNTGVFLSPAEKIASIGVQVRHRLTTHGFSLNVTREPLPWFEQIVACGLADVKAVSISTAKGTEVKVDQEIPGLVSRFGQLYERDMAPLKTSREGDMGAAILALEEEAESLRAWAVSPRT
ncbi:hypothetical protein BD626DRAFT_462765 [Schizophyllum amplum]|uniref:lipoyl(octanoyl) transferase n=1 Tax=Schizophyllum amplum TaxID=97359 RepID=A0A550C3C1_9AGAR|nr:hypothetical protein BD626DRAFT_462765 [Auriculariopsis ampla]